MGYKHISYPSYPESFNAKRKLFSKTSKHEINACIQKLISKIILEHELGRGEEQMEYSYILDGVEVMVTYDEGKFHAYVTENDITYDTPIKTDIEFEYAEDEYDKEWKIRKVANEEHRLKEWIKENEEKDAEILVSVSMIGILMGGLLILTIISKLT